MNARNIKKLRTESVLKQLVPEALSTLGDAMLKGLCVTDVECTRGKYDAFVYLDKMILDEKEQEYVLTHLKKVNKQIQNYCMEAEGWFRCPVFHFKFDDRLEHQNKMDDLFDKISKDLNKNG